MSLDFYFVLTVSWVSSGSSAWHNWWVQVDGYFEDMRQFTVHFYYEVVSFIVDQDKNDYEGASIKTHTKRNVLSWILLKFEN